MPSSWYMYTNEILVVGGRKMSFSSSSHSATSESPVVLACKLSIVTLPCATNEILKQMYMLHY